MTKIDTQAIEEDWKKRGYSCDLMVDPPGQQWEDFTHPTDEVVVVLEGTMEFEVEGQTSRPQPGQELFIPARAIHSARNIGSTAVRWLYGYKKS